MLKEHSQIAKGAVIAVDTLLLLGAFGGAYIWRRQLGAIGTLSDYFFLLYFSVPFTLLFFFREGLYGDIRFDSAARIAWKTVLSLLMSVFCCSAFLYLVHATHFSRLLFGYYFVLASGFLLAEKVGFKLLQDYWRAKGHNIRQILIIGGGCKLERLLDLVRSRPEWGLNIVGVYSSDGCQLDELRTVLEEEVVDEVYIAFSRSSQTAFDIGAILALIERFGKIIKVIINIDEELRISRVDFCRVGDLPALAFYSKPLDPDQLLLKRGLDLVGSVVGLLLLGILLPFIAVAIKLDSPGPIFFSQSRVGLNGRRFTLHKFRSMYADAETRKEALLGRNEHQGPIFKLGVDPRVTRAGRFLRRMSLDEFPQFWNVLKGDMSLVGTRPPTPDEVEHYQAWHYRRISIRPGLTGLWQVSGRNEIRDFDEIVNLDLKYIGEWNLWLDLKILLKTIWVVWKSEGSSAREHAKGSSKSCRMTHDLAEDKHKSCSGRETVTDGPNSVCYERERDVAELTGVLRRQR